MVWRVIILILSSSDRYKIFTRDRLWIEVCQNEEGAKSQNLE